MLIDKWINAIILKLEEWQRGISLSIWSPVHKRTFIIGVTHITCINIYICIYIHKCTCTCACTCTSTCIRVHIHAHLHVHAHGHGRTRAPVRVRVRISIRMRICICICICNTCQWTGSSLVQVIAWRRTGNPCWIVATEPRRNTQETKSTTYCTKYVSYCTE